MGTRSKLWDLVRGAPANEKIHCPSCPRPMQEVNLCCDDGNLVLDVCRACQFVWFDPGEFEALPAKPVVPPPAGRSFSEKDREEIASAAAQKIKKDLDVPEYVFPGRVESFVTMLVPLEKGDTVSSRPIITWILTALLLTIGIWINMDEGRLVEVVSRYTIMPGEGEGFLSLALFTHFFVHIGPLHLVVAVYCLWVCGDNVEDYLGPIDFLLLLVLSITGGVILPLLVSSYVKVEVWGAFGGLSGVLVFYLCRFPHVKFTTFDFRFGQYFTVSAGVFVAAWFGFLGLSVLPAEWELRLWNQWSEFQGLIWQAGGGAITGVTLFFIWRDKEQV